MSLIIYQIFNYVNLRYMNGIYDIYHDISYEFENMSIIQNQRVIIIVFHYVLQNISYVLLIYCTMLRV